MSHITFLKSPNTIVPLHNLLPEIFWLTSECIAETAHLTCECVCVCLTAERRIYRNRIRSSNIATTIR